MSIKNVRLVENENSFTGWTLIMDGGDGVDASIGEIAMWEVITRQNAMIVSLTERIRGKDAIRAVKAVSAEIERMGE